MNLSPDSPLEIIDVSTLYITAFCDEAGGTGKRNTSRHAIVVVGQDRIERVFILHTFISTCSADKLIDQIFTVNDFWLPARFGVDATGNQKHFVGRLKDAQRERGIHIPFVEVDMPGEKTMRIESIIQPRIVQGKLFRPPETQVMELKGECLAFPNVGAYRDGLDALAGAIALLPKCQMLQQEDHSAEELKEYLQKRGLSQSYIERRVKSLYGSN